MVPSVEVTSDVYEGEEQAEAEEQEDEEEDPDKSESTIPDGNCFFFIVSHFVECHVKEGDPADLLALKLQKRGTWMP